MKNDIDLTENSAFADEESQRRYKHKCLPWVRDSKNPNGLVKMKTGEIEFRSSFGKYYYVNTSSWIDDIMSNHDNRFEGWKTAFSSSSTIKQFTYYSDSSTNNQYETIFDIDMGNLYPSSMITADFSNLKYKLLSRSDESVYSIVGKRDKIRENIRMNKNTDSKYKKYVAKSICPLHDYPKTNAPWNIKNNCKLCKLEGEKRKKKNNQLKNRFERWCTSGLGFRRRALSYYDERFVLGSVPTLSNYIPPIYNSDYGHKLNIIKEYYNTYPEFKEEQIYHYERGTGRYVNKHALYYKGMKRFRNTDPLQPEGRKEQVYDKLFENLDWRKVLSKRLKMIRK